MKTLQTCRSISINDVIMKIPVAILLGNYIKLANLNTNTKKQIIVYRKSYEIKNTAREFLISQQK